jgi:hypothetical protein
MHLIRPQCHIVAFRDAGTLQQDAKRLVCLSASPERVIEARTMLFRAPSRPWGAQRTAPSADVLPRGLASDFMTP